MRVQNIGTGFLQNLETGFLQNTETGYYKVKISGPDHTTWKITDRKWKRDRRVQYLRKTRRHKCLSIGLALVVIACMILICAISYSSIRAQANIGFKYYTAITVESGETLWSIADRYMDFEHYTGKDAYISEIERINHLNADETLLAGQILIIPYYSMEYIP